MGSSRHLDYAQVSEGRQRAIHHWRHLHPNGPPPTDVEVLQSERARSVYRLVGAANSGGNVIAKRARLACAVREQTIYQEVLPQSPDRQLRLYGLMHDGGYGWIFIEEAVGREYDPTNQSDVELAGQWLATLHTTAWQKRSGNLATCGTARFTDDLHRSRVLLTESADNKNLDKPAREILRATASNLKLIARRWTTIARWCDLAPQTLTHGDFKEENIRVCDKDSKSILAFDWHQSGWGPPVLDQAKFLGYSIAPDITAYYHTARKNWPWIGIEQVYHWGFIGETFRCIASIRWEAERMRYAWLPKALLNLEIYQSWLADIVLAEPWKRQAPSDARRIKLRSWV